MFNNPIITRRLQILFALIISYGIVRTTSGTIFIANTPRVNTQFISSIRTIPQRLPDMVQNGAQQLMAQLFPPQGYSTTDGKKNMSVMAQTVKNLPINKMIPVSKGVYAQQDASKILYLKITKDIDTAPYEERTITIDGEKVKVRFPKQ